MLSLLGALWNLFLMIIPFGLILIIEQIFSSKKGFGTLSLSAKILFLVLLLLCILFFPNIPYIFTDVRHLLDHCTPDDFYKRCPEAPWAIPLFFSYAVFAIPIFILTVEKTSIVLGILFHPVLKHMTPLLLLPLSALGVLLGYFERLNSWNIFHDPQDVFQKALPYLFVPEKLFLLVIFTISFLFIFYLFHFFRKYHDT